MGALILASVLLGFILLVSSSPQQFNFQKVSTTPQVTTSTGQTKGLLVGNFPVRSAGPPITARGTIKASSTNYQPYSFVPITSEDVVENAYGKPVDYQVAYSGPETSEFGGIAQEFSSIETDKGSYSDRDLNNKDQFLDPTGYKQYDSQTSFNLEGPKQLETIETTSFYKESAPYHTETFQKFHEKEEEERAEVHYHQHKHLHKHQHKQEHSHKHKEEHQHGHEHKHEHKQQHEHKHKQEHKHEHLNEHKHEHKSKHEHKHKEENKHVQIHGHKHEHKHKEEHNHNEINKHTHKHLAEHQHKHQQEHKHDHNHQHKHLNAHKHDHKHNGIHSHKHGHKHDHKHSHYEKNYIPFPL